MGMFPIAFLTLVGILEAIDSTLEDAALDLSATRWETFKTITLPLATPGILSAWLLVFTTSLADFANPLLLSGDFRVLSVESYLEVTGMNRLGNGAALSLLLLLPTLTAFLAQRYWVSRKSVVTVTGKPSVRLTELASPGTRRVLLVAMSLVTLFLFSLYGTILAGCFVKNWGIDYTFTLANFREALERGRDALSDTVLLAALATPVAGILAMAAAMLIARKAFIGQAIPGNAHHDALRPAGNARGDQLHPGVQQAAPPAGGHGRHHRDQLRDPGTPRGGGRGGRLPQADRPLHRGGRRRPGRGHAHGVPHASCCRSCGRRSSRLCPTPSSAP